MKEATQWYSTTVGTKLGGAEKIGGVPLSLLHPHTHTWKKEQMCSSQPLAASGIELVQKLGRRTERTSVLLSNWGLEGQ